MSVATNFQCPGTAFTSSPDAFFTKDGYLTRNNTLSDPFPGGIHPPQGRTCGKLAEWELPNQNDPGTETAKNADIYEWKLGFQQAFPFNVVLGIHYSANRSTHLSWG